MQPKIPLPRSWNRRVRAIILQVLALSHYGFTAALASAANVWDPHPPLHAAIDRLEHDVALLH